MMTVTEKAAYLKGLVEMAHFDADTDEVKIIKAMVDASALPFNIKITSLL